MRDGDQAGLSLFAIGDVDEGRSRFDVQVPRLLSFMATDTLDGEVRGMNDLQREYERTYGPGDYKPIPCGDVLDVPADDRFRDARRARRTRVAVGQSSRSCPREPAAAHGRRVGARPCRSSPTRSGWIFTEMGRQPWTVFGVLRTSDSDSPTIAAWQVATSLSTYVLLYTVLAVDLGPARRQVRPAGSARRHAGAGRR